MTNKATITFSQAGVQPPVYVVTSLSDPPWETLEMRVDEAQPTSADRTFVRHFDSVPEGDHQYKIRIGDGHWVVDESKDSATDQHGNRNNVVHVKPAKVDSEAQDARKVSSTDAHDDIQLSSIPIPFVVVEKVPDKAQPEYGATEPHPLARDVAKRSADFQPDFETTYQEIPAEPEPPKSREVPLLVVEKTDDRLEHGDDFGDEATAAQKIAHDKRAADASPDKLVVSPDAHVEPGTEEEQAAPLFRHEFNQEVAAPSITTLDTLDELSTQSSADQTSSEDNINTPGESQDEEASSPEPLMPHDADSTQPHTELGSGLLLPHEASIEEEEGGDELSHGPRLSHETGLNDDTAYSDEDQEIDELDVAPLLPHETGFSRYKGSEIATNSDILKDDTSEPRHYAYDDDNEGYEGNEVEPDEVPTFTHEDVNGEDHDEEDDIPLLPHERGSAISDDSSPEGGDQFTLHSQPTFDYETDSSKALFGGSGRPNIFRTRTNSSTLPHRLPSSDAEDENLHDPSLERFPTSREQILQRVATIGLQLPEDQTIEDDLHSPVMSVLSQACSSVDLAPVKSYTSLASVPEADDSDEGDGDDGDMESLPSPMVMNLGRATTRFARDPYATPISDDRKRIELAETVNQKPIHHTTQSSEADSVGKNDGAKDFALRNFRETIATPAKVLNTITPPLTPEKQSTATIIEDAASSTGSELHQRRTSKRNVPGDSLAAPAASNDQNDNETITSSNTRQLARPNESFLQNFFHVVFGSVGRFLTACLSDRKRAGATILVAGTAVTAYYVSGSA